MEVLRPRRLFLLLAAVCLLGAPASAEETGDPAEEAYQKALDDALDVERALLKTVDKVRKHSVSVGCYRAIPRGPREGELVLASCGSGVLVEYRSKTWVLTNVHVIRGAQKIEITTHDGARHVMVEHDSIPRYDISLLRFAAKPKKRLRGVRVKASSEKDIKEGSWVIATGNPFFLAMDGASVTTLGVISGLDRNLGGKFEYVGAIQHDAEVNPGNSGGPLWNLKGALVGINGKIATRGMFQGARPTNTGASFSLPISQVASYLKRLAGDVDAASGFLGITAKTEVDKRGKSVGALVTAIHPRSPALNAIMRDDLIKSIRAGKSKTIYTADDLRDFLSHLMANTKVTIKFKRGRRTKTWSGVLGKR